MINGPYIPGENYLPMAEIEFGPDYISHEIVINGPGIENHGYFSFKVMQELSDWHSRVTYIYVQYNGQTKLLPSKPTPTQVMEFLEYRVRIPKPIETPIVIGFLYQAFELHKIWVKDLIFSPIINTQDEFEILKCIPVQCGFMGLVSPITRNIPLYAGDVVNLEIYPYIGADIDRVEFEGVIYNENGVAYPSQISSPPRRLKLKYLTPFDDARVRVYFKEAVWSM
jgi:hypothetical protein